MEDAIDLLNFGDGDDFSVVERDFVTRLEGGPHDGSIIQGIDPAFFCGGEKDGDSGVVEFEEDSKSKFGFCFANPALSGGGCIGHGVEIQCFGSG